MPRSFLVKKDPDGIYNYDDQTKSIWNYCETSGASAPTYDFKTLSAATQVVTAHESGRLDMHPLRGTTVAPWLYNSKRPPDVVQYWLENNVANLTTLPASNEGNTARTNVDDGGRCRSTRQPLALLSGVSLKPPTAAAASSTVVPDQRAVVSSGGGQKPWRPFSVHEDQPSASGTSTAEDRATQRNDTANGVEAGLEPTTASMFHRTASTGVVDGPVPHYHSSWWHPAPVDPGWLATIQGCQVIGVPFQPDLLSVVQPLYRYLQNVQLLHPQPPPPLVIAQDEVMASSERHSTISTSVVSSSASHRCQPCGRVFSTLAGLTRHAQTACACRSKSSSPQSDVSAGRGGAVASPSPLLACPYCDKVYTSSGALKLHVRTHTLPCRCPQCGKAFSRPWLLQGHLRTHTGERPFRCAVCQRAFADRSNLRAHAQTHAAAKRYQCPGGCRRSFSRLSLLARHQRLAAATPGVAAASSGACCRDDRHHAAAAHPGT